VKDPSVCYFESGSSRSSSSSNETFSQTFSADECFGPPVTVKQPERSRSRQIDLTASSCTTLFHSSAIPTRLGLLGKALFQSAARRLVDSYQPSRSLMRQCVVATCKRSSHHRNRPVAVDLFRLAGYIEDAEFGMKTWNIFACRRQSISPDQRGILNLKFRAY
jgi:hypothetical protein